MLYFCRLMLCITVSMKRWIAILTVVIGLAMSNLAVAQLQWRETKDVPGRSLTDPRATDGVEIYGSNGTITIRTTRRITVRVFTILGQNVSTVTLNPGTSELRIGSRGIFIVKIGNLTQKVAL